ncbi:tyrosinase-like protein 1 [Mytilus edulis]|uniref:tyrosinase-like protein 1 n=1 Tax=Mytilus edulis TaxID=6550 RepID=UPI0039F00536
MMILLVLTNQLIILISILSKYGCDANIYQMPLPANLISCLKNRTYGISPTEYPGEDVTTFCVQEHLWVDSKKIFPYEVTEDTSRWVLRLFEKGRREKEQILRIRKEYRMLTKNERNDYHRAVQLLKQDQSVLPNKYDAIVNFHRGDAIGSAHFGPAFPGWHRIFCLIFEEALREIIPTVTLPYWDSTLDSEMKNPEDSIIFSKLFIGNPDGLVTDGPYANWHHDKGGLLTRNVGAVGRPLDKKDLANILSRKYNHEILNPTAKELKYNLENHHGKGHSFVGGNMGRLRSAAEDPLFFSYHAFIDCIWEQFRIQQMLNGIDPSKDYPNTNDPLQHPYRLMDGFIHQNYTNIDGYSHHFTRDIYTCQEFPTCSPEYPDCGSFWLFCDQTKWVCISKSYKEHLNHLDSTPVVLNTVQNRFEINGRADMDAWVYLTVKVYVTRPPTVNFKSYAIRDGKASSTDVFSASHYQIMSDKIHPGNPKSYSRRRFNGSGMEKIFIQTDGLNYDGTSLEYAIIDERFAMAEAITYVPVKNPGYGVTKVLLTAFDSGGRLCRPFCKRPDTGEFEPCSGAVAIDSTSPLMFGNTYADNILSRYEFKQEFPYSQNGGIFIIYYCDFQEVWPWDMSWSKDSC